MLSFYLLGAKKIFSYLKNWLLFFLIILIVISVFFNSILKTKEEMQMSSSYNHQNISKEIKKQIDSEISKNIQDEEKKQFLINLTDKALLLIYNNNECLSCKNKNQYEDYSLAGIFTRMIILPFENPPASGIYWLSYQFEKSGLFPKSYAFVANEGIGLAALRPFLKIWQLFRDTSYTILVLILIVIGFMIMLRTKINPQTVITIENALPKIIITLILITLSFPIAGFLIDLMYVVIMIIIQILSPSLKTALNKDTPQILNDYISPDLGRLFINPANSYLNVGFDFYNILSEDIKKIIYSIVAAIGSLIIFSIFKNILGTNPGEAATSPGDVSVAGNHGKGIFKFLGHIGNFLLFLVIYNGMAFPLILSLLVIFTLLLLLIRIFIKLFLSYIQLILLIIFSPIILILEAIPGKEVFLSWVKNIIANLLAFVITITLVLTSASISSITRINPQINSQGSIWAPPFIFGVNSTSIINLISIGILLIIPNIITSIKEKIAGKGGLLPEVGLSLFFGGAGAVVGTAAGFAQGFSSLASIPLLSGVLGRIPGVPWLKKQLIPEGQAEISRQQTITLLQAMAIAAGGKEGQEIRQIADQLSQNIRSNQKMAKNP